MKKLMFGDDANITDAEQILRDLPFQMTENSMKQAILEELRKMDGYSNANMFILSKRIQIEKFKTDCKDYCKSL